MSEVKKYYYLNKGKYIDGVVAMYDAERVRCINEYEPGDDRVLALLTLDISEPLVKRAAFGLDRREEKTAIVEDVCRALSSGLCTMVDLMTRQEEEDREGFMTERIEVITRILREAAVHAIRQHAEDGTL